MENLVYKEKIHSKLTVPLYHKTPPPAPLLFLLQGSLTWHASLEKPLSVTKHEIIFSILFLPREPTERGRA